MPIGLQSELVPFGMRLFAHRPTQLPRLGPSRGLTDGPHDNIVREHVSSDRKSPSRRPGRGLVSRAWSQHRSTQRGPVFEAVVWAGGGARIDAHRARQRGHAQDAEHLLVAVQRGQCRFQRAPRDENLLGAIRRGGCGRWPGGAEAEETTRVSEVVSSNAYRMRERLQHEMSKRLRARER